MIKANKKYEKAKIKKRKKDRAMFTGHILDRCKQLQSCSIILSSDQIFTTWSWPKEFTIYIYYISDSDSL